MTARNEASRVDSVLAVDKRSEAEPSGVPSRSIPDVAPALTSPAPAQGADEPGTECPACAKPLAGKLFPASRDGRAFCSEECSRAVPQGAAAEPTREEAECQCGAVAHAVTEQTVSQWGEDGPRVSFADTLYRCPACGEAWYTAKQSMRHTTALLGATIAALRQSLASAEARAGRIQAYATRALAGDHDKASLVGTLRTVLDTVTE